LQLSAFSFQLSALRGALIKIGFVTGHDFSRAANAAKSPRASAPDGMQALPE
jgi:hypothetical protein